MEHNDAFSIFDRALLTPPIREIQNVTVAPRTSTQPEVIRPVRIKEEPQDHDDDVIFVSATPAIEDTSDEETESESEEEEEEETIWTLLKEWGLDKELGQIFAKYRITLDVLKNLNEEDLRVMVPDRDLSVRVMFRTNLKSWQSARGYGVFDNDTKSTTSTYKTIQNWVHTGHITPLRKTPVTISNANDLLTKRLDNILITTSRGRYVLQYSYLYTNEPLPPNWRTSLCVAIAEYCTQQKYALENTHFEYLSNEILKIFKNEIKDGYYTPPISKTEKINPSGYLVDEYNNCCRNEWHSSLLPSGNRKRKRPASPKPRLNGPTKEQQEVKRIWLSNNTKPWFESGGVLSRWKQTYLHRKTSFMNSEQKEHAVDEWPILGHNLGYSLIEMDFEQMYADKFQSLFDKWDRFCVDIFPIYRTDIYDAISDRLLREYPALQNQEMKNCTIIQLLNSVLAPSEVVYVEMMTPEGKKKSTWWEPSIRDVHTSFFNLAFSEEHAKEVADAMTRRYTKVGLPPQPLIFGIGYKYEHVKKFIVNYHNIYYSVNSFLKAVNIVFKLYHVFHLEYNRECRLLWLFIQRYFFDIVTPRDKKSTEVSNLLSRLK